jgi:hypothetical protein
MTIDGRSTCHSLGTSGSVLIPNTVERIEPGCFAFCHTI